MYRTGYSTTSPLRIRLLAVTLAVPMGLGAAVGCNKTPEPEKATDLERIQPQQDEKGAAAKSKLPPIPDGPAAVVGGVEIPREKFMAIYELKLKKYVDRGREVPTASDRRYRKSIIDRLIWAEVLRQEAAKLGVTIDPKDVEARLQKQREGIKDWEKHLERRGETEDSLRELVEIELLEKAILNKLGRLAVTDEEIRAEYEKVKDHYKSDKPRVRASHILIPVGPKDRLRPEPGKPPPPEPTEEEKKKWEAEALAKAKEIYEKAKAPDADFAALAREYSEGPSGPKGGDLGIFTKDRMVEEFAEAAFRLGVGEVSKPVKTKFGYHIIKVTGKWPAGTLPLDALEDQIRKRLEQRKLFEGKRDLKKELLSKYEIKNNIEPTLGPDPRARRPKPPAAKRTLGAGGEAKSGETKAGEAKAGG
ncbi:MAG: hypothetical protein D6705_14705 [Deltaproteobacteria bacterium]|nr:MAG: hypothetical protein D6705_14705 [Deltaproteobacteria bacterium]